VSLILGLEYFARGFETLIESTLAKDGVLVVSIVDHVDLDALLFKEHVENKEAIDVDEKNFRKVNADQLGVIHIDVIINLKFEVKTINVVKRSIELNVQDIVLIRDLHLGLARLLRLLEEAEEGTDQKADCAILEHANEPGDDEDPELEFVSVPQLSHDCLWNKSAGGGNQDRGNNGHWNVREDVHEKDNNEEHEDSVDEL